MKEWKLFEIIKNNLLTSGQDGRLNALFASSHNHIKTIEQQLLRTTWGPAEQKIYKDKQEDTSRLIGVLET